MEVTSPPCLVVNEIKELSDGRIGRRLNCEVYGSYIGIMVFINVWKGFPLCLLHDLVVTGYIFVLEV